MSDHTLTLEAVAAALAGELAAADAERMHAHLADCAACRAAAADLRSADAAVRGLFAGPGPALEDRVIRSLRAADATPKRRTRRRVPPLAWGVAACVGLGAVGAAVSSQVGGDLPLPWGEEARNARTHREAADDGYPPTRSLATRSTDRYQPQSSVKLRPTVPMTSLGEDDSGEKSLSELTARLKATNGVDYNDSTVDSLAALPKFQAGQGQPAGPKAPTGGGTPDDFADRSARGYFRVTQPPADGPAAGKPGDAAKLYFQPAENRWDEARWAARGEVDKKETELRQRVEAVDEVQKRAETEKLGKSLAYGYSNGPTTAGVPVVPTPVVAQKADPAADAARLATAGRKIILRSGDIEFEIESFDSAVAGVTKLVTAIDGAFVATVNSDKLANGKVKGAVTVRVPPDKLDGLVLDLRRDLGKGGELKGQRIGSQDVTKQYTDLESRLKAARTMETRLLAIIKDGKGEIKQLLDAEKELGVWRTKIEEIEGELRYYANLAALSTLTITLTEKEIKAAAAVTESEVVQTGVEVEDVEQAFRDAQAAVAAANGRVTLSDLKQHAAGQFNATLNFEVAPAAAGPVRDRLRQLGRVARLEITRATTSDGKPVPRDAKVTRGDTRFQVQLYNVANVAPRETVALSVAAEAVPAAYRAVREAVEKAKGKVVAASLSETDPASAAAQFDFEVKRADEPAVFAAINSAGEVVSREASRAAESDNVTDTKVLVRARFVTAGRLPPRETTVLAVETENVDLTGAALAAAVQAAGGKVADSATSGDRTTGERSARYVFEVPLAAAGGIADKAKDAGEVKANQTTRNPSAPAGRFATARVQVTLSTPERIVSPDDGFLPRLKKGLGYSATALYASLTWLVYGLCVVLPWAVVLVLAYRLVRRLTRSTPAATPGS